MLTTVLISSHPAMIFLYGAPPPIELYLFAIGSPDPPTLLSAFSHRPAPSGVVRLLSHEHQ